MNAQALIARIHQQRQKTVELEPGKKVTLQRPPEAEFGRLRSEHATDLVLQYTTGWEGFTEADLLGQGIGAADKVDFDTELWAVVARDRLAWLTKLTGELVSMVSEHLKSKGEAAKN